MPVNIDFEGHFGGFWEPKCQQAWGAESLAPYVLLFCFFAAGSSGVNLGIAFDQTGELGGLDNLH